MKPRRLRRVAADVAGVTAFTKAAIEVMCSDEVTEAIVKLLCGKGYTYCLVMNDCC